MGIFDAVEETLRWWLAPFGGLHLEGFLHICGCSIVNNQGRLFAGVDQSELSEIYTTEKFVHNNTLNKSVDNQER